MNTQQVRPVPGLPVISIADSRFGALFGNGPRGLVREVVGPHSPLCGNPKLSLPLVHTLRLIEQKTCRVISTTKVAGVEEASAALKLLGPTALQPVLISGAYVQFLRRTA